VDAQLTLHAKVFATPRAVAQVHFAFLEGQVAFLRDQVATLQAIVTKLQTSCHGAAVTRVIGPLDVLQASDESGQDTRAGQRRLKLLPRSFRIVAGQPGQY
jgi:hypothetical protein